MLVLLLVAAAACHPKPPHPKRPGAFDSIPTAVDFPSVHAPLVLPSPCLSTPEDVLAWVAELPAWVMLMYSFIAEERELLDLSFSVAEMFGSAETIAGAALPGLRLYAVQKNSSATPVNEIIEPMCVGGSAAD